jgi:hypothetical protein
MAHLYPGSVVCIHKALVESFDLTLFTGSTTFTSGSIYQAAQYGTVLENAGMTRGSKSHP